ncbi:phosphotransferase family protein [Virgibacillus halodenitrificans]|uniref:phosphotransferase family protein n=1 Tax=Virgibacillus halodenitrificans TaxID=1482 RepID=UPI001F3895EF|nr:phosphotransferase family protein [Virgibacillus halodenitrificans]
MADQTTETIEVRKGEELDKQRLADFITGNISSIPEGKLELKQFAAGHSNLTYLVKIGDWEAVLRRPPCGPVAPKAHDMEREYRILSSLNPVFSAAPKPYIFSDDSTIIGSPFFLMERRNGVVLDTEFPANIDYKPELGKKISELMVDQLVALHQIDYQTTELATMTKPDGFMERQVAGWIKRYERAETDDVKDVGILTDWLQNHIPASQEPSIIHYDYKLNNAMFSADFKEMTGLFDWEMTTVGNPLADLGAAMSYWIQSDDPEILKRGLGKPPVTVLDGFYTRKEFLEAYAEKSGRDISDIHFYLTFAYFKLAVICQQIYYRYKQGQTKDKRFAHFDTFVANLIRYAWDTAKGGGVK